MSKEYEKVLPEIRKYEILDNENYRKYKNVIDKGFEGENINLRIYEAAFCDDSITLVFQPVFFQENVTPEEDVIYDNLDNVYSVYRIDGSENLRISKLFPPLDKRAEKLYYKLKRYVYDLSDVQNVATGNIFKVTGECKAEIDLNKCVKMDSEFKEIDIKRECKILNREIYVERLRIYPKGFGLEIPGEEICLSFNQLYSKNPEKIWCQQTAEVSNQDSEEKEQNNLYYFNLGNQVEIDQADEILSNLFFEYQERKKQDGDLDK